MRENAGQGTLDAYLALYAKTVAGLKSSLCKAYESGFPVYYMQDMFSNPAWYEIADLELLYHILTSTKKRVVVCCGAMHGEKIASFLLHNGYDRLAYKSFDVSRFISRTQAQSETHFR